MKRWDLQFGDQGYPFYWGRDCGGELVRHLSDLDADLFLVVGDANVDALHGRPLQQRLASHGRVISLLVEPPGEGGKTLETLSRFADEALAAGATRRSVVVTVGGGVPGNVGGLLASVLFRGIRLVHVPTSLIGMFDSVVSLKQAVNTRQGKNLLGTYYRPTMVLADVALLASLPAEQVRSGLCEVIKNALVIDPTVIPRLEARLEPDCRLDPADVPWLLEISLEAKSKVMAQDPRERGPGIVLEYGHTVGHAIELAHSQVTAGHGISHGEAVAVGMLIAGEIAHRLDLLPAADVDAHYRLLEAIGARTKIPAGIDTAGVLELVDGDNKRGYCDLDQESVAMILLEGLGRVAGGIDRPLTATPRALVGEVVDGFLDPRLQEASP